MPTGHQALIVVTDLDGCLLDSYTYEYEAATPALASLAAAGHILVLCSAKTRAEMAVVVRDLRLAHPYIVENGGAIVFPPGSLPDGVPGTHHSGELRILALGAPRSMLVPVLGEVAAAAGVHVRGFADMGVDEVARLTGLTREGAERALDREYDEPFVVDGDEEALAALRTAAALRGFGVSHGGRFHHLTGGSDKGLAVRALLACYERAGRRFGSVGLGDAATDLSMLRAVDRAIVVPRRDGTLDPMLAADLSDAERAPAPGPAGWNAAVNTLLEGGRLPVIGRP